MKHVLLFALGCLLLGHAARAQDILVTRTGDEIKAKVLEILPQEVRYKRFDYPDGPTIIVPTAQLFMIRFQNGASQLFGPAQAKPVTPANQPETAPAQEAPPLAPETIKLAGPRIGVTVIGQGKLARKLDEEYEASPILSQFGWQFETRFFTAGNGMSGLVEWVPLVGGLEQGLFLPSLSALVGLRSASGMEFGVGPNLSLAGAGLAFAAGVTVRTDYVYFPVNFAVVPSRQGVRYSLLTGFNLRKQ